jgi:hypothetical protein
MTAGRRAGAMDQTHLQYVAVPGQHGADMGGIHAKVRLPGMDDRDRVPGPQFS